MLTNTVEVFLKEFGKVDMHGEWGRSRSGYLKELVEAGLRSVEPLREVMADDQLRSEMGARGQPGSEASMAGTAARF